VAAPAVGGFSKYDLAGAIYGPGLDRYQYLDRMLASFNDPDYEVPYHLQQNVGDMFVDSPYDYFAQSVQIAYKHLYGNKTTGINYDAVMGIFEEVNHRFAYAIARGVREFASLELINGCMFDILRGADTPKKRYDPLLVTLQKIYEREEWGWEADFLRTPESYAVELERQSREPLFKPRDTLYPVYHRRNQLLANAQKRAEVKQATVAEQARAQTGGCGPVLTGDEMAAMKRRASRRRLTDSALRQFRYHNLGQNWHPNLVFPDDLDELDDVLTRSVQVSLEMKQLGSKGSLVERENRSLELLNEGWWQDDTCKIWWPKEVTIGPKPK
jgi:RNAse (barnase) inhibitor barstar